MAPLYQKGDISIFLSGEAVEADYAKSGYEVVEPKVEPAYPEGQDPAEGWTVAQLTAWAGDHGVEVPAGPKAAVVDAVLTALDERKARAAGQEPADTTPPADPTTPPQE